MTTYIVRDDTWRNGKHYTAGDVLERDEDPGNWCERAESRPVRRPMLRKPKDDDE